jgi:hypothetical protein
MWPPTLAATNQKTRGKHVPLNYNLFRRKEYEALCCAVPEDLSVPGFVDDDRWEFRGSVADDHKGAPGGFDSGAAKEAVRFNGFYLFQEV